ncbi:hypothetical protein [Pseudomonas aeruginosa]|uniref:hypothetical protein n=1 Tax=Pseudomonas aeruginosa TaxID=287 RepID=UPI000EB5E309|nr:hypothetical protein [Pseudomonas aeruginosa]
MSILNSMTTRSDKFFSAAFSLAIAGQHHESDELLELAHEMRELELQLAHIAQHAPTSLAVLLLKEALTTFDDGSDDEYVEQNRATLKFYADNDAQMRQLVDAALNPPCYSRTTIQLSSDELEAAKEELALRIEHEPGRRSVTDPVITPAAIAIARRGFTEFRNGGHCSILRQCPDCQRKYSTKVHAKNRIYWHCPHCNTIKEA